MALDAQPQAADAALAAAFGRASDLDWEALPAHLDLLAGMAQSPAAAAVALAVPLDPSQLIPCWTTRCCWHLAGPRARLPAAPWPRRPRSRNPVPATTAAKENGASASSLAAVNAPG